MKIIVLQVNRMGDLLLTVPLLARIKKAHPVSTIYFVCLAEFAEIIMACPFIDQLCCVTHQELSDASALKQSKIDLQHAFTIAINLSADIAAANLMTQLTAQQKCGRLSTSRDELLVAGDWGKYFYAFLGERPANLFHISDMMTGIGDIPFQFAQPPVSSRRDGTARFRVALQMGASHVQRAWPVESFKKMAALLGDHCPVDFVLIGGLQETHLAEEFLAQNVVSCENMIAKTTLAELQALLQTCDLLISNDTGPVHIAAAQGVRVLGLYFSHAYFAETAPYGTGHVLLQAELPCSPCAETFHCPTVACRHCITPDAVAHVAAAMLENEVEPRFALPNLSVYQTVLHKSGLQHYLPLQSALSFHFCLGLLGQRMWLAAFAENPEHTMWVQYLSRYALDRRFPVVWQQTSRALADMIGLFAAGSKLSAALVHETGTQALTNANLKPLMDGLSRIERHIETAQLIPESWRTFYTLTVMDLEYVALSQLASAMGDMYSQLKMKAERALAAIADFPALVCADFYTASLRPLPAVEIVSQLKSEPYHYRQSQFEMSLMQQSAEFEKDILIVVHDQYDYIKTCIESIAAHTKNYHLWIWDNGSQPQTAEYLQALANERRIHLKRCDANHGFIIPNNRLAQQGSAAYLILLNSDTQVLPGWDRALISVLDSDPSIALTGYLGGLLNESAEAIAMALGFQCDYIAGFCLCLARQTFDQYGLFDETLRMAYFEDSDLSIRLKEAGKKIYALYSDLVRHYENKTVASIVADDCMKKQFAENFSYNQHCVIKKWQNYLQTGRVLARQL